ncbi:MAG TPA: hypothetical protein EYG55_02255 [Gemmatimonadetes bacterium]|nr:hypothetical protein [Planctomycetota bacterium]HIL89319.1 hypothetical protein [Gemmatimonadota bacterium]
MRSIFVTGCALFLALVTSNSTLAQNGSDDCAAATPIVGPGSWNFDNTGFSIDGPPDCNSQPVRRDLWYVWTATGTGDHVFTTCGGTILETRIVVYDGFDCAGFPQIACAASTCGGQSNLTFAAISGQQYLMRLGSRQAGASGSGTFTIAPDFCSPSSDSFDPNGVCVSATSMTDGTHNALVVSKSDPDYYVVTVAPGDTLQIDLTFLHADGDVDMFLYDDCDVNVLTDSTSASNNETLSWVNPTPCDTDVWVRIEVWSGSDFSCNTYDLAITGTGGGAAICNSDINYLCDPANVSSSGTPATILATGSLDFTDVTPLQLAVGGGPVGEIGYFLCSAGQNPGGFPVSNGMLCLVGPYVRYSPNTATYHGPGANSMGSFDANGVFRVSLAVGASYGVPNVIPSTSPQAIQPGDTWVFQLWFVDGPGVSNFSSAVAVTFH